MIRKVSGFAAVLRLFRYKSILIVFLTMSNISSSIVPFTRDFLENRSRLAVSRFRSRLVSGLVFGIASGLRGVGYKKAAAES